MVPIATSRTRVVLACIAISCLAGCAKTGLMPSMKYAYPKPLDGWDRQIVTKYCAEDRAAYLRAAINQLPFLAEYNVKYPPAFQALAMAAAQYDKAAKSHGVVAAELAACEKARSLADARMESLKQDMDVTVDFKERLQAIRDDITAIDNARSKLEGDFILSRSELNRTLKNVNEGYAGLRALAAAENTALGESKDPNDSLEKIAPEYYKLVYYHQAIARNMPDKLAGVGFGLQYLESMRIDRNKILGELITAAQGVHKSLDRTLFFSRSATNIGFDGAILGTTGIASVAGSESTSRALSSLATVLTGIQKSTDKELFFQQTSTALLHLMQADVDTKAATLAAGMAKGVDEYSLEDGLDDYVDFLLAGDLTSAVKLLDAAAADKSREANASLRELKDKAQSRPSEIEKQNKEKRAAKKQELQNNVDLFNELTKTFGAVPGTLTLPAAP